MYPLVFNFLMATVTPQKTNEKHVTFALNLDPWNISINKHKQQNHLYYTAIRKTKVCLRPRLKCYIETTDSAIKWTGVYQGTGLPKSTL